MNKSGNTPLIKNNELTQKFGFAILIKDESKNPFGTWKDRRSQIIIKKAKDEKVDTLVLITSGNARLSGLSVISALNGAFF
ncbi:MAG: pyridoxal-phosphate dependent enzyme [Nanoarchaeota archaeon]